MKQISLRLDDDLHKLLSTEAKRLEKSLSRHIIDLTFQRGEVYTTNLSYGRQVRFNLTYLGDLLVMGMHSSFNGLYEMMVEAINNGDSVILERHYTNALPTELRKFTNLKELAEWKEKITSIN